MESVFEQPRVPLPPHKVLDRTKLSLLPCEIQHDGNAKISEYFFLVNGTYGDTQTNNNGHDSITATTATTTVTTTEIKVAPSIATTTTSSTETIITNETLQVSTTTTTSIAPEVSFRGRTLKGTVISVPNGYIGSIYKPELATGAKDHDAMETDDQQEENDPLAGLLEDRKIFKTDAQFQEFMAWGHDYAPSLGSAGPDSKVLKAMQWTNVAAVLHKSLLD